MIFNKFSLTFKISIILIIIIFGIIFGRTLLKDFDYYEKIPSLSDVKFKTQDIFCKISGGKMTAPACSFRFKYECSRPFSDAGKPCQNSKMCQGTCLSGLSEFITPWVAGHLIYVGIKTECKYTGKHGDSYICPDYFFKPKCSKYPDETWGSYEDGEIDITNYGCAMYNNSRVGI